MANERRRAPRQEQHALYVRMYGEGLTVRCLCGATLGGRRFEDRTMITLADMLELVRLHHSEINSRR